MAKKPTFQQVKTSPFAVRPSVDVGPNPLADLGELGGGALRVAGKGVDYLRRSTPQKVGSDAVSMAKGLYDQIAADPVKFGLDTLAVVTAILERNNFVEQNFNSCIGLLRMADKVGFQRMENACKRARLAHKVSYTTVKNILENNLDKHQQTTLFDPPPIHTNIRGSEAFN